MNNAPPIAEIDGALSFIGTAGFEPATPTTPR
jgi:hypothetical protein